MEINGAEFLSCTKIVYIFSPALPECGSVINNTLKSPWYPNNYPGNMDCTYTIPIPPGGVMKIIFEDFKLEDDR